MTVTITLSDAINKMNPGDRFMFDDPAWCEIEMYNSSSGLRHFKTTDYGKIVNISVEIMNKKGWITLAEPEILSIHTIADQYDIDTDLDDNYEYGEACEKNGQLKRDADYKEIRESLGKWIKEANASDEVEFGYNLLTNAHKNLKPLD